MRIKYWLLSIVNTIRIWPNRNKRRWLNKRCRKQSAHLRWMLAAGVTVTTLGVTVIGNADEPLFPCPKVGPLNFPNSIITGDFNGDGFTDLAMVTYYDVSVLLGTGDGSYAAPQNYPVGDNGSGITTGDFNGDGFADLATANKGDYYSFGDVSVLLGVGDGTFLPEQRYPAGGYTAEIITSDFNGDGFTDLAAANWGAYYATGDLSVFLGFGDGTFAPSRGCRREIFHFLSKWGTLMATGFPIWQQPMVDLMTYPCCWVWVTARFIPNNDSRSEVCLFPWRLEILTMTTSPT